MMNSNPFEKLHPALESIGARFASKVEDRSGPDTVYMEYWNWNHRLVRLTYSVMDSFGCEISMPEQADLHTADWTSVFEITVPGLAESGQAERIGWMLGVPKGPAFTPYLATNIQKLPEALKVRK